jgi:DNA-binding NarL/FixJ family response regulator
VSRSGWWTLSQRIRTVSEIAFEVTLVEASPPLTYQRIAEKAIHLNQLGLSNEAIARHLGVDGKTVAKAVRWGMGKSYG